MTSDGGLSISFVLTGLLDSDMTSGSASDIFDQRNTEKCPDQLLQQNFRSNTCLEYSEVLSTVLDYPRVPSELDFEQDSSTSSR